MTISSTRYVTNPAADWTARGAPRPEEVNAWQAAIAQVIRDTESALQNKHLIAGQEAFAYSLPMKASAADPMFINLPTRPSTLWHSSMSSTCTRFPT